MTASDFRSTGKAGVVEDLVDIFGSPSAVYERRRDTSAWLPLIVVTVVLALAYLPTMGGMQPIMDAEYERGVKAMLESDSRFTREQMDQGRAFGEAMAKFMFVAGAPIAMFFCGLGLALTGKLVDAQLKLGTGVMIAAWAFVPRIVGALATAIQLQLMRPEALNGMHSISTGPARFLDPDTASPMLVAVAGRFDVFILWTTVLLGIGCSVVGRVSRFNGMLAAMAVWVLGTLFALFGAIR